MLFHVLLAYAFIFIFELSEYFIVASEIMFALYLCTFYLLFKNRVKITRAYFEEQKRLFKRCWPIGAALFVITAFVLIYPVTQLSEEERNDISERSNKKIKSTISMVTIAIFMGLINPVMEEVFWRVHCFHHFCGGTCKSVYISFNYALYHIFLFQDKENPSHIFPVVIVIALFGLFLQILYKHYGICNSILVHFAVNVSIVFSMYTLNFA